MTNHPRRVILIDTANAKVKELATRLMNGEMMDALNVLEDLATGRVELFAPPPPTFVGPDYKDPFGPEETRP
jgi:hypothetical protein